MKLSITRILAELKLNESKINTALTKKVIGLYQKRSKFVINSTETKEEFEKTAKENYQSLNDLLQRNIKLRSALINANTSCMVKIGENKMSLAEAISYKDKIIPIKRQVLNALSAQYASCSNVIDKNRDSLESSVERLIEQNLGNDRKADKEAYESIAKPFIEANEMNLLDPAKIKEELNKMEDDINVFEAEINIVLSEANARYEIDV